MVITGHVKKNVIILDEKIKLPEGTKVMVSIPEKFTKPHSGLCGIWRDNRPSEEIVNEIISSRSEGRNFEL